MLITISPHSNVLLVCQIHCIFVPFFYVKNSKLTLIAPLDYYKMYST